MRVYTDLRVFAIWQTAAAAVAFGAAKNKRMLYSTEEITNSTTGFVKMVVEPQ